jgi:hypothetical protein
MQGMDTMSYRPGVVCIAGHKCAISICIEQGKGVGSEQLHDRLWAYTEAEHAHVAVPVVHLFRRA